MKDERPCSLLVVEDERPVAKAIARVLECRGHEVTVTHDCATALATGTKYDGGIFDIDLPDGSGLEVAETLLERGDVVVAVFFSASDDEQVKLAAADLGTFIGKRAGIKELAKSVAESIGESLLDAVAVGAEGVGPQNDRASHTGLRRKR